MAEHMTAEQLRARLEWIIEEVQFGASKHGPADGVDRAVKELRDLAARLSGMAAAQWCPMSAADTVGEQCGTMPVCAPVLLVAKTAECQCDRLGKETVECAQIIGEALRAIQCPDDGPVPFHIDHLPEMCRDLVAELTRLRAVEAAAAGFVQFVNREPDVHWLMTCSMTPAFRALAEACGRKGR
jgi:hypothetical protein